MEGALVMVQSEPCVPVVQTGYLWSFGGKDVHMLLRCVFGHASSTGTI